MNIKPAGRQLIRFFGSSSFLVLSLLLAGCQLGIRGVSNSLRSLQHLWPFSTSSESEYIFDSNRIHFSGGACQLTGSDQIDHDPSCSGFGDGVTPNCGGTGSGTLWGEANVLDSGYSSHSVLRLDPSGVPTNTSELNSGWTPQYAGLVFYWNMNGSGNVSSSNFAVQRGADRCQALTGTPAYVPGQLFSGIQINSSQEISCAGTAVRSVSNTLTIAGWVKHTGGTALSDAVIYSTNDGTTGWRICRDGTSSDLEISITTSGQTDATCGGGSLSAIDGTWHHVAFTVASGTISAYLDGQLRNTCAYTHGGGFASTAAPGFHGLTSAGVTLLDDWGVWNTVLTAAEMTTLHSRQSARYSGTFTSRVMDAFSNAAAWNTLSWVPSLPFLKELPDSTTAVQNETSSDYSSLVGSTGSAGADDLMNGIVGLWHLNESSGTSGSNVVIDVSGQANPGTTVNSVTFGNTGRFRTAAGFNGSNTVITVADSVSLKQQDIKTISFWMKKTGDTTAGGSSAYVVRKGGNYATNAVHVTVNNGSPAGIGFFVGRPVAGSPASANEGSAIYNHRWYHVVGVIRGGTIEFWRDGELRATSALSELPANDTEGVRMGGRNTNFFNGVLDEVAIWNRPLHASEIQQLYRRGANRIQYQVRTCSAADCSDDSSGMNWKGPDGTNQSYFSELYNVSAQSAIPSGSIQAGLPSMTFAQFTSPAGASRYFQYRAILESDDAGASCDYGSGPSWCSPELKSVTLDPLHYDSTSPSIVGKTGVRLQSLSSVTETLGSSCASGISYNLGVGSAAASATWYWWDRAANTGAGGWRVANGTAAQSNSAADLSSQASASPFQATDPVYFKAFLKSTGTAGCALDQLELSGKTP